MRCGNRMEVVSLMTRWRASRHTLQAGQTSLWSSRLSVVCYWSLKIYQLDLTNHPVHFDSRGDTVLYPIRLLFPLQVLGAGTGVAISNIMNPE